MNDLMLKAYISGSLGLGNLRRFLKDDERGVTAVEYAIVLAGVAAVVAVIFGRNGTVNTMLTTIFADVQTRVQASMQ